MLQSHDGILYSTENGHRRALNVPPMNVKFLNRQDCLGPKAGAGDLWGGAGWGCDAPAGVLQPSLLSLALGCQFVMFIKLLT